LIGYSIVSQTNRQTETKILGLQNTATVRFRFDST